MEVTSPVTEENNRFLGWLHPDRDRATFDHFAWTVYFASSCARSSCFSSGVCMGGVPIDPSTPTREKN